MLHPSDSDSLSNDDADDDGDVAFADDGIDDEDLDDDDVDEDDDALAHHGPSSDKRRMPTGLTESASTASELMFNPQSFSASLRAQTMPSRLSSFAMSDTVDDNHDATEAVHGNSNKVTSLRANAKPKSASAKR